MTTRKRVKSRQAQRLVRRWSDDEVEAISDVIHTRVQLYNSDGGQSNGEVLQEIEKALRQEMTPNSEVQRSPFRAATGLMGSTESGQRVTVENAHFLPPGSVVRLDAGGRLFHLHDGLWLYFTDCSWCYDSIEHHAHRLPGTLCHIPANNGVTGVTTNGRNVP